MVNTHILYIFNVCAFSWNKKKKLTHPRVTSFSPVPR